MPALLGLLLGALLGALAGRWISTEWGATIGGLIGFFAGALLSGRGQRSAFRKPDVPAPSFPPLTLEQRLAALEQRLAALEAERAPPLQAVVPAVSPPLPTVSAAPAEDGAGVQVEPAREAAAPAAGGSEIVSTPPANAPPTAEPRLGSAGLPTAGAAPVLQRLWAWFTGGNAMTRIGVVVLFFGVAFLLRYFAEHFTIPITVRLLAVALAGVALVIAGWRVARRRPAYGWSLQGAGMGVLYLTTFAAFRQFDLLPAYVALVLLAIIAALTVWLALIADAQPLAALALAGAFLAPVLTDSDRSPVPLFAYFAVVNGVVLVIAAARTWRGINLLGFVFTFVVALFWGDRYYRPEEFVRVEPFLVLFFAMYVAVAILQARRQTPSARQPLDGLLIFGVPVVAFALQVALVRDTRYGAAWSALAVAAAYAALAWFLRRGVGGTSLLARMFVGLAAVFASLAIPFAFDNRVTAALWSVEGALLYWLGIEQRTPPMRLFALLLQVAAGVLFIVYVVQGDDDRLFLNAFFIGAAMLATAGVVTAWLADARPEVLGVRERATLPLVFAWGALWWLAAGGLELVRQLPAAQEAHAVLAWVVAAAAAALWLRQRLAWPRVLAMALALPVVMLLIVLRDVERTQTTLLQTGWLIWPVAWLVQFLALRAADSMPAATPVGASVGSDWRDVAHVVAAIALTAHVAWEASEWAGRITADDTVWVACAAALPAILYIGFATRWREATWWPLDRHARSYALHAARPVALVLVLWIVLVNVLSPGEPYPLPYVPLANPLDLTLAAALLVLFRWSATVPGIEERTRYASLGIGIFLSLNGGILRAGHHWGGIPWDLGALLESRPLQATLTLAWSATGAALMFAAAKRNLRPLWMVGAALLAIVVAKLFLLDLGGLAGLPRVVAFLGVGTFLLVVGYVSPLPPGTRATSGAVPRDDAESP